jgi:type IV secretion system protein VirB2
MSPSLFDAPRSPVLADAMTWLTGTLLGTVATGLCVLAVATVGFMMLTGRLPIREGGRVVLGCFVLLGASSIAIELRSVADGAGIVQRQAVEAVPASVTAPRRELPPSNYDPYAGASLRNDNHD